MPDDYIEDPTLGLVKRIRSNVDSARKEFVDMAGDHGPIDDALCRLDRSVEDLDLLLGRNSRPPRRRRRQPPNP